MDLTRRHNPQHLKKLRPFYQLDEKRLLLLSLCDEEFGENLLWWLYCPKLSSSSAAWIQLCYGNVAHVSKRFIINDRIQSIIIAFSRGSLFSETYER